MRNTSWMIIGIVFVVVASAGGGITYAKYDSPQVGDHYAAALRSSVQWRSCGRQPLARSSTLSKEAVVHLNGWAVSFHSSINASTFASRSARSAKFGARKRLR